MRVQDDSIAHSFKIRLNKVFDENREGSAEELSEKLRKVAFDVLGFQK